MQTLADLNKKVFYRVIKVLYFGIFILVLVVGGMSIYDDNIYYPSNGSKTRITCETSGVTKDVLKSDYGITGVFAVLSIEQKQKIAKDICDIDPSTVSSIESEKNAHGLYLSYNNVFIASESVMEESLNYGDFSKYFLILLVILTISTEFIRRIFYYIVFGTFTPKK